MEHAFKYQRQKDLCEYEARLVYKVSYRTARETVLGRKKKE